MAEKRSGMEERIIAILAIALIKKDYVFDKMNWLQFGKKIGLTGTERAIRLKARRYWRFVEKYQEKAKEIYRDFFNGF
jgi:hypothetical protein